MGNVIMQNKYSYDEQEMLIDYINSLSDYRGYVQFSHRALEAQDIFEDKAPNVAKDEKGFVYEAHFFNGKESIMIRQQNAEWVVSTTLIADVEEKDMNLYALEKTSHLEGVKSEWVKMAQIWEAKADKLCEGMDVMKLQKVIFAGFVEKKGEEND